MKEVQKTRAQRLTRALVYAVIVVIPMGLLAYLIRADFDPLIRADNAVLDSATDVAREHDTFRSLLIFWETLSQPWIVYLLIGLPVAIYMWVKHRYVTRALWAIATMAGGWALSAILKLLMRRARPEFDPFEGGDLTHHGFSFPSGHVTNNAVFVTVMVLLLWPLLSAAARKAAIVVATIWLLITCADRLFLGAHYLSDVVAGVILGVGLVVASYAGYQGWSPKDVTSSTDDAAAHPSPARR